MPDTQASQPEAEATSLGDSQIRRSPDPLISSPTLGALLKQELDKNITREAVPVLAPEGLKLGSVLGLNSKTGQAVMLKPNATDGSELFYGILLQDLNSHTAPHEAITLARGPAIVSKAALVFDASVKTDAQKAAVFSAMSALGIAVRTTA